MKVHMKTQPGNEILSPWAGEGTNEKEGSQGRIKFLFLQKEDQKTNAVHPKRSGLLASAKDWEMNAVLQKDLVFQKHLVFPSHIAATTLWSDIVLWLSTTK